MTAWRRLLTSLSLSTGLAACATIHRPPTTIAQLRADAVTATNVERATRDSAIARLVRRAVIRGDRTIDVLMLSGGGDVGSYGVGFLRGWRARTDNAMPSFDLVTGISTGALQAPYALLGTPPALDSLTTLYRDATDRSAPTLDWWFWLRHTGGVVTTTRYDQALAAGLRGAFRDDLRRAFAVDRQILIATSDYDLASGRTWSLNDALDASDAGLRRTTLLLKAATAIPGIFPPVIVDGHVHGDGGVITNVLPLLSFADYGQLAKGLAARGITNVTIRVYVIMNLWTQQEPRIIAPSSRKQISARANLMLFYTHQPQTIELLDALARAVSGQIPGMKVELLVSTVPSDQARQPGAEKLFDRDFMHQLDLVGFAKAQSTAPWDALPSAYRHTPPAPK